MPYSLHEAQKTIATDKHRFRVVICGRRFGKTTLAVWQMFAKAVAGRNRKVAYIAPNFQQARDIAWAELKKITAPLAVSVNESRLEVIVKTQDGGTSQIILRGWEAVDSLRGQAFHLLILDEVSSYRNFWLYWQETLRATLTDFEGEALFITTPKGYNHVFDLYNLEHTGLDGGEGDPDYRSFHYSTYDNPHIPVKEIDKAKATMPDDKFAQEYMADFRKSEGLVYKEFDRNLHTFDMLPKDVRFAEDLAGVDFGFNNPAAVIHIKRDTDNNYWVYDEWYETHRTEDQIAEYVRSCNFHRVYPDPENPSAISLLNEKGVQVYDVKKGKGSVENGIDKVRELFKTNRLKISIHCKNLIEELESYRYPNRRPDKNESEAPIKADDHALDAMRYALVTNSASIFDRFAEMKERLLARQRIVRTRGR